MTSSEPSDQPAIGVEGASKLFLDGAVVAFRQLSLDVRRNEIMCIVGPSRLRQDHAAALHRRPDRDSAAASSCVHGKPVHGRPPDGVAMVFQHFGLLPWKTVYDNAAFGLAMARTPRGRDQASASRTISNWSASPASRSTIPISSPAACSSASAWCARSP